MYVRVYKTGKDGATRETARFDIAVHSEYRLIPDPSDDSTVNIYPAILNCFRILAINQKIRINAVFIHHHSFCTKASLSSQE
jgi:hypothetical protein